MLQPRLSYASAEPEGPAKRRVPSRRAAAYVEVGMEITVGLLCMAFVFGVANAAGRSLDRAKRRYAERRKGAFADEELYGDL